MKYRSEIDGLRALAVLPVILYHAGYDWVGGGYVGVDVFFVISGYLIITIIVSEQETGSFSVVRFYERRARRILPALTLVLFCTLPAAWLWMLPDEFKRFSESLISVTLFLSNFHFFAVSDYFAPAAEVLPLLHTWSLAVEEQFYVFFPLVLMVLWRWGRRSMAAAVLVSALVSLALAQFGGNFKLSKPFVEATFKFTAIPDFGFYLIPTRAWELMLGAMAALYLRGHTETPTAGGLAQALGLFGIGAIVYAVAVFDDATPTPSLYTLVPTVGTVCIIVFARPGTVAAWVLSLRPVVAIGLISYSAYLWHFPVFVFARIRQLTEPSAATYALLALASLMLAWASWRWVERPFRDRHRFTRGQILAMSAVAAAAIVGLGVIGKQFDGFPSRLPAKSAELLAYRTDGNSRRDECFNRLPDRACVYGDAMPVRVAILGDSHADAIAFQLGRVLAQNGMSAVEMTYSGCPPVRGLTRLDLSSANKCAEFNEQVFKVLRNSTFDTLVLASRWTAYIERERFDNGEGGVEYGGDSVLGLAGGSGIAADEAERVAQVIDQFKAGVEALLALGKRIVLVYPIPEVGWDVPKYLAKAWMQHEDFGGRMGTRHARFIERNRRAYAALDAIPDRPGLIRVLPEKLFCDSFVMGRCVAQLNGRPLYFDNNHLSSAGARMLANEIVGRITKR